MTTAFQRSTGALGLIVCGLLTGCGPGAEGRYPVRGKVTYNGEPVSGGSIVFVPVDASADGAIKVGALVTDGEYDIPATHGPRPGAHKVEIVWRRPTGRKLVVDDPPTPVDERINVIPELYSKDTTLTAEIKREHGVFDFQLTGPLGDLKKR